MASSRPLYCAVTDLTARLFADEGTDSIGPTPSTVQNALLSDLISIVSRRFDQETERPAGCFAPQWDVRLYSGEGSTNLEVDEFAVLSKIEINTNPPAPASWKDVTPEVAAGGLALLPIRTWPKNELWRIQTLYPDPYRTGNVRLTGVFGAVQPDLGAAPPASFGGLTSGTTPALSTIQPVDPVSGSASGWWIIPEDVKGACIAWALHSYKEAQAGYGDTGGQPSAAPINVPKAIPQGVQDVISVYVGKRIHLAMIALDGTDFREELTYGNTGDNQSPFGNTRWAGWQTTP